MRYEWGSANIAALARAWREAPASLFKRSARLPLETANQSPPTPCHKGGMNNCDGRMRCRPFSIQSLGFAREGGGMHPHVCQRRTPMSANKQCTDANDANNKASATFPRPSSR